MVYGYARISTPRQSITRQIRNIKEFDSQAVVVQDAYTGTKMCRPGWERLYKALKSGDIVIFDSVSRMSRDAEEGFQVYEELYKRGVSLIFLKERHIDTDTYRSAMQKKIDVSVSSGDKATDELLSTVIEALNKYIMDLAKKQIYLAFEQAEKEVQDLRQRTREGIETARLNGKQIGQQTGRKLVTKKSLEKKKIILEYSRSFNGTLPDPAVMKLTDLARNTYYKYKRELQEEVG